MAFVVPAVLGGLALAVVALVSAYASRKRTRALRHASEVSTSRVLIHSINDDRCTGCDACVAVCPTNVLDLVENKSRVLHFQDCIQCEACMWACPTTALVMHPEGTDPPLYRMPELDEFFQTAVPGQYLIGEVAGKPLVKNAANLGRGVVEHMFATGLRPMRQPGLYDVVIVGSGPGGLSAALTCIQRGFSYVVLDKENLIASTVARYPKGKLIMAEPYDVRNLSMLPVFDSSKEEMVPIWRELIERVGMKIRLSETVETVARGQNGIFEVKSNGGTYHGQRVVLSTGLRGKPRMLGVPGEAQGKVYSLLEDPDLFRGQAVCVIGGGDSALEAAIALADSGAKVVLSYRGRSFARAQQKNKKQAEAYEAERRIKIKYGSQVVEFGPDTITLEMTDGSRKRYPNEAAFVLIGADPPIKWLNKLGIRYVERPHMFELSASAALVERFLGNVVDCPPTAEHAAMLARNEELPDAALRMMTSHGLAQADGQRERAAADAALLEGADDGTGAIDVSGPRRFIRAATQMFRGSGKLEKPMPLSEFAKAQRKHSGRGRRDQLDAGERTRILRMLRDDGARQADEESKIFFLEDLGKPENERRDAPYHLEDDDMSSLGTFDRTDERTDKGPPPAPRAKLPDAAPKPAVIVGLARANAEGPRVSRRPKSPGPLPDLFRLPDNDALRAEGAAPLIDSAPFFRASPDEATQFTDADQFRGLDVDIDIDVEETQMMSADAAIIHDHTPERNERAAAKPAPKPAPLYAHSTDFQDEERTMLADFDPAALMAKVEAEAAARREVASAAHGSNPPAQARKPPPPSSPPPPPQVAVKPKSASGRRTKLPPPPGRDNGATADNGTTDPDMLFSDSDIDLATAAIDLNRLSTDSGLVLTDDDLIMEDSGSTKALDPYIPVQPPGPEDQTNTRVDSLSDVDWDLE